MSGVGEPPAPGEWPEVRTKGDAPPPNSVSLEEGTVLAYPPEVIAHGFVAGIPWTIQAWSTATAPGAKWWEVMVAAGPQMEFHLGAHGFLGGGGIHVRVPDKHFFTASGHFFGRAPYVIAWAGVVTKEVERLEVVLEDGRAKEITLHDGPADISRFFWVFPPRGVPTEIVAYGRGDQVLERKTLPEVDVTPEQNAGTSVNPAGWRADRPPPGWPDEAREFAPGEGPRREEDFLLHIAPFPVFVVPPETWEGIVSLAGHGGHGTHASYVPTRIEFEYLDIPGEPTRGMHVVNVDSSEEDSLEKRYPPHREEGLWWFDAGDDAAFIPQLPGRFREEREGAAGHGERSPRGRRYLGQGQLIVSGTPTVYDRWEYQGYPELVEIRFRLPRVAIRLEGWNLSLEEVRGFAVRLERLELGSGLLGRMTKAATEAAAAWEKWLRKRHPDAWPA